MSELSKGTKVELEHTRDRRVAESIASDHLAEDPNYYRKLVVLEATKPWEFLASGDGPSEWLDGKAESWAVYLLTSTGWKWDGTKHRTRSAALKHARTVVPSSASWVVLPHG